MNFEPLTYFSFDGTCKLSRGGDTTLKFDDDTTLKTHSALLKMSSPIFHSMLTDCANTMTFSLKKTSRETWVHILNHLHPAASLVFTTFDPTGSGDQLADLLEQARKFSLDSMFTFLDSEMCANFPKVLQYIVAQESADNQDSTHTRLYSVVLRFEVELPKTSEKVRANVVEYLKSLKNTRSYCSSCGRYSGTCPSCHRNVYFNGNKCGSCGRNVSSAPQNQPVQAQKRYAAVAIEHGSHDFYKKLVDDLINSVL